MRQEVCDALVTLAQNPDMVFLTGDLGFMALEPLQKTLGQRFINAGVAEQNMVSVAAAMAKDGWQSWCYSIAPFCYARPFEQIRNDVCLHDLPVKLIGNGGGYGYGVMGPTHHAVEDYAVMLALPNMKVFVPCFNEDVQSSINSAATWQHPCYIRLGRGELPEGATCPTYQPWRRVLTGDGPVVISVGPIGGVAWSALRNLETKLRPHLWILTELPVASNDIPPELKERLREDGHLIVIEEHIAHGGVGSQLAHRLLTDGVPLRKLSNINAAGLTPGVYGSQAFLRKHSGLCQENIRRIVTSGRTGDIT